MSVGDPDRGIGLIPAARLNWQRYGRSKRIWGGGRASAGSPGRADHPRPAKTEAGAGAGRLSDD
jgi:hypothetical protein